MAKVWKYGIGNIMFASSVDVSEISGQLTAVFRYIADRFTRVDSLIVGWWADVIDCEELSYLASRLTLRSFSVDRCKQNAIMITSNKDSSNELCLLSRLDADQEDDWASICAALSSCYQMTSLMVDYVDEETVDHLAKAMKDKANLTDLDINDYYEGLLELILNPNIHRLKRLKCHFVSAEAVFADDRFAETLRTLEYLDYEPGDYEEDFLDDREEDESRDKELEALIRRLIPQLVQSDSCRRKWYAK